MEALQQQVQITKSVDEMSQELESLAKQMQQQKVDFKAQQKQLQVAHAKAITEVTKWKDKCKSDHSFFKLEMQRKDKALDSLHTQFTFSLNDTIARVYNYLKAIQNRSETKT